jgi:predicted alpha/beta hydrolase
MTSTTFGRVIYTWLVLSAGLWGARMSRSLKRVVLALMGLAALTVTVVAMLAISTKLPGEGKTPSGFLRDTALYVTMRDGVPIAVDVWLPQDYQAGQRLPVLLRTTRYGRDGQFGWAYRLAVAFKQAQPHGPGDEQTDYLNQRHFVVIVGDARGSGASGGHRETEFSREEISDLGELVTWAAKQPWSNGRIGTFGQSYEGATAELASASSQSAIHTVAALSSQVAKPWCRATALRPSCSSGCPSDGLLFHNRIREELPTNREFGPGRPCDTRTLVTSERHRSSFY